MPDLRNIHRRAHATWARPGRGEPTVSVGFGPSSEERGSGDPEELVAAAEAACFTATLASVLRHRGLDPRYLDAEATVTVVAENGGYRVSALHLKVEGDVPEAAEEDFRDAAADAKGQCLISRLLRPGLDDFSVEASLGGH